MKRVFFFMLAIVVSSCSSIAPAPTLTNTPPPTNTSIPTNTHTPTATATITVTPTQTEIPTPAGAESLDPASGLYTRTNPETKKLEYFLNGEWKTALSDGAISAITLDAMPSFFTGGVDPEFKGMHLTFLASSDAIKTPFASIKLNPNYAKFYQGKDDKEINRSFSSWLLKDLATRFYTLGTDSTQNKAWANELVVNLSRDAVSLPLDIADPDADGGYRTVYWNPNRVVIVRESWQTAMDEGYPDFNEKLKAAYEVIGGGQDEAHPGTLVIHEAFADGIARNIKEMTNNVLAPWFLALLRQRFPTKVYSFSLLEVEQFRAEVSASGGPITPGEFDQLFHDVIFLMAKAKENPQFFTIK